MAKLQSATSENIVIGALINNLNLLITLPEIKPDYFGTKLNQVLLKTLKNIFKDGAKTAEILDIYALCEVDVSNKKLLDECGGLDHLETLRFISEDKDELEVNIHVQNIIECAYKNTVVDTLNGLGNFIESKQELKMESANKLIEKELLEIKSKFSQTDKIESIGSRMNNILSELGKNRNGSTYGFPTFSPMLNQFMTYEKGEMVVISGKAKAGKSQVVINETFNLAIRGGQPTLILDTELSDATFTIRLASRITGFNFNYIKKGLYVNNQLHEKRVNEAFDLISKSPIFHQYIVGWDNEEILNEVKRLKIQENIQILFYDYIKVEDANENEHRVLGNITNFLKNDIAGALKIAVVAFAQMSDYSDANRLKIANSERIKNYASTVIFLVEKTQELYSRDLNEKGGNYYMFVSYNRNGLQMKEDKNDIGINITFNRGNATFEDAPYQNDYIINMIEEQEQYQ